MTNRVDEEKRILIMIRDREVREYLAKILIASGYAVSQTEDERSALRIWEQTPCAMIFVGVGPPEWAGLHLAEQVRLRETFGNHVPIAAITDGESKAVYMKCLAAGINGFVDRTVERERLLSIIGVFTHLSEPTAEIGTAVDRQR